MKRFKILGLIFFGFLILTYSGYYLRNNQSRPPLEPENIKSEDVKPEIKDTNNLKITTEYLKAGTKGKYYSQSISGFSDTTNSTLELTANNTPLNLKIDRCKTTTINEAQTDTTVSCNLEGLLIEKGSYEVMFTLSENDIKVVKYLKLEIN